MLDFTSGLYLGFEHRREELQPWPRLSTGKPAALWEPMQARRLGREVALLQGCEAGLVSASTLHLFLDLLGWLAGQRTRFFLDAAAYAIASWGAQYAASRGAPLSRFRHRDADDLNRLLRAPARGRPVVIVDGFCPTCGFVAPLRDLLECVRHAGGLLVVDDTQASGIFGVVDRAQPYYGSGGGGSLRHVGFEREEDVIVVSSLAKALGVPLAVLSGPARLVGEFEQASETRVHCTPPSMAAISAGLLALARNRIEGDGLRQRLGALVTRFRSRIVIQPSSRGVFPFQLLTCPQSLQMHRALLDRGIQTVLREGPSHQPGSIGVLFTAKHTPLEVDTLTEHINRHWEALCLVR